MTIPRIYAAENLWPVPHGNQFSVNLANLT